VSGTVTKTLQATLVQPTTGKEQRLQRLLDTYRDALHDAFDTGADTMSAVNDVVTPYDLPYQAKDAFKSYVPKLRSTYNAEELDDEHPLRLVNRAAEFDYSDEREHGFVWQVPQPSRGTNFWIPLRINPEQESLWFDLLSEDATAGELRLQRHRTSWELHVTVEYPVEEPTDSDDPTYIRVRRWREYVDNGLCPQTRRTTEADARQRQSSETPPQRDVHHAPAAPV
jgi:hypothetical protein